MNKHDKVMTENFAERFVDHRNVSLATQAVAKLALHHRECGLDVAALIGSVAKTPACET
jgi:hypothetical protein